MRAGSGPTAHYDPSMTAPRILVVDDEPTIRNVLASYLRREGYDTITASDGPSAVAADEEHEPDLLVLDVLLPGFDGLQVMARVRHRRAVPIILLTARGEEGDRIGGLRLGADDYVVKPFSPREVVARVAAVLRRAEPVGSTGATVVRFGAVEVDAAARTVLVAGAPVELTAREFDLLHHLTGFAVVPAGFRPPRSTPVRVASVDGSPALAGIAARCPGSDRRHVRRVRQQESGEDDRDADGEGCRERGLVVSEGFERALG